MNTVEKCPICGFASRLEIGKILSSEGTKRVQCQNCELIYFDRSDYQRPEYDTQYNLFFSRPGDIRKAGIMAALISETILDHNAGDRILEIGPGNGLTAFLLKFMGFQVVTIDDDWESCSRIIADFKIPSWPGKFEESRFATDVDFIYAGHVIEHSENPRLFFKKANENLLNGGLFFFDTPDADYASKRGSTWKHFKTRHPYEHCCLMTLKTVKYLAEAEGFEIVSRLQLPGFDSMQILLRKK